TGRALGQIQLGTIAGAFRMRERHPRKVAEVTVFARRNETHGNGVALPTAGALVAVPSPLGGEGICSPRETSAAVTHKPTRELQRTDPGVQGWVVVVPFGRHSEVALGGEIKVWIEHLQPRHQGPTKPRVIQRRETFPP